MVAASHLLYPGGQFDSSWCEELVQIGSHSGKPLFSLGTIQSPGAIGILATHDG
jgi:hypothetical protein